jgi:hypothetical protein
VSTFRSDQGAEEWLDLEQSFLGRDPPKPICTISSHNGWVWHLEEGSKDIHFSIMRFFNKAHVPLRRTAQNLHIIRNWGILHTSNTNEIRKSFLQNRISALQIMLNFCPNPIPHLKLAKPDKVSHHFLMFFHNPTPKALTGSREHHSPHKLPNLESTTTLHQACLSIPNRYNHLPNKAWLNISKFLIPRPAFWNWDTNLRPTHQVIFELFPNPTPKKIPL